MSLVTPPNSGSRGLALATTHLSRAAYKRLGELQSDWFSSKKQKTSTSSKKKQKMGRTVQQHKGAGFYKGGFATPTTVTPKVEDMVLTKGSGGTIETYGRCEATDIVWVGASTCNIPEMAFHTAKGMLRKLLKQAGLHITNAADVFAAQIIFPPVVAEGKGFILRIQYEDGPGDITDVTYPFSVVESLDTLANNSGIKQAIIDYANASSDKIACTLKLYQWDYNPGESGKIVATINLKNEMIHFHSAVKVVVQNRTRGSHTGATNNLDVIDSQPLKGKMYYFKKSNPEVRQMNNTSVNPNTVSTFSRWSDVTVKLISGDQPGYDAQIKEPPTPQFWSNCSKVANISLEPGDLKDIYIANSVDKYYQQFVRSLAWYNGSGNRRQKVGDCLYVCLEERLNSGSSNPIVVQYEAQADFSCYFTTNKIDPIIKTFASNVVNKIIA